MKEAIVTEIQVCGGRICHSLIDACREYLAYQEETDREKLHFSITLADGSIKAITIRQDGNRVICYGDFAGIPNAFEWAMGLKQEGKECENGNK